MPDEAAAVASAAGGRTAVWDIPVRLTHWAIAALFGLSWWSAENERLELHVQSGMAILVLLVFRLIWGIVGGSTARFSQFVKGPRAVIAYLRGEAKAGLGHNPLGALSVVALLLALIAQVTLGLFAQPIDSYDMTAQGPLSRFVSYEASKAATDAHHAMFNVVLALVALHLAAILFYLVRRKNLIGPMLTGRAAAEPGGEALKRAPWWRAWVALFVAWMIGGLVWSGLSF